MAVRPRRHVQSTALELNQAVPAYQTGAFPRSPAVGKVSPGRFELPSSTIARWRSSAELRRVMEPRGIEPRSRGCKPRVLAVDTKAPCEATAETRTRPAALATPRAASDTTVAKARTEGIEPSPAGLEAAWTPRLVRKKFLERDSNRAPSGSEPEILPIRRSRIESCGGWARTSIPRLTAGRPAVGRRRIKVPPRGFEPRTFRV
jgi:hypothetical protein